MAAGFHAVLQLPPRAGEAQVIAAAAARRVGLYGVGADGPPRLVLGFGSTPRRAIDQGIAVIADLLV